MHLRKEQAGGDSYGNTWPEDGAVVEVPDEQGAVLLDIPHAGFTEVPAPEPEPEPEDEDEDEDGGEAGADGDSPDDETTTTEVAPDSPDAVTEPPKPRTTRARKATGKPAGTK